jgi:hypothetical protein
MGFFNKKKEATEAAEAAGKAQVHVEGMMADPAILGGPSSKSVDVDDPMWEPIEGVSLEQYASITKGAADQGVTDEAGVLAFAESQGVAAAAFQAAMNGWNDRMKESMAVGQQFNKMYMGR